MPPRRSAASEPALARNQPAAERSPDSPARSRSPPIKASRYPIDRSNSEAVGLFSGSDPHSTLAARGATMNDTPDEHRIAPATTASALRRRSDVVALHAQRREVALHPLGGALQALLQRHLGRPPGPLTRPAVLAQETLHLAAAR